MGFFLLIGMTGGETGFSARAPQSGIKPPSVYGSYALAPFIVLLNMKVKTS